MLGISAAVDELLGTAVVVENALCSDVLTGGFVKIIPSVLEPVESVVADMFVSGNWEVVSNCPIVSSTGNSVVR